MNKWITIVIILSSLLFGTGNAQTLEWVNGGITNLTGINCSIIGNTYSETMLNGVASYLHYSDFTAPATGDGTYVKILMSIPGLNCNTDSSVDFVPSLVLPPGASLNISASNPVKCYFKTGNLAATQFTGTQIGINSPQGTGFRIGPVCPDGLGGGYGTPFAINPNTQGTYGGIALGFQYLTRTSFLEIQIPIRFSKELKGAAGPNGGDKLRFLLDSSVLTPRPASAETWINVPYKAQLDTPSSTINAGDATISSTLFNYFEGGFLSVDYGTTASFGQSLGSGSISNTNESQPVTVTLGGLNPGSMYSYRFKFVTSKGTFYSPTGTFSTSASQNLALNVSKTGNGTISSNPAGINCGSTCTANFTQGSSVTLNATPDAGSSFNGWSGACSGTGACTVTMDAAKSVSATFSSTTQAGSMELSVSGLPNRVFAPLTVDTPDGRVLAQYTLSGTTSRINTLPVGTYKVNAPDVANGSNLYRATAATQTITVNSAATTTVNVVYTVVGPNPNGTLEVLASGLPNLTVVPIGFKRPNGVTTSESVYAEIPNSWDGIPTGAYTLTAADMILNGVTYRPTPATQTATVNPGATTNANIVYAAVPNQTLTVSKAGTGNGTISSNPAGIDCGTTCTNDFGQGTNITLTATAANGSSFNGWGGACSGTGTCVVTMDAAKSVTATFNTSSTPTFAVNVSKTGNGTILSIPSGINCGTVCTANFVQGTTVTLTATPATGSSFSGWSGACSGTGTCEITVNAIKNLTVSFTVNSTRSIQKSTNTPTDQSINKGSSNNPAVAFTINAPNEKLSSITLSSNGSGNDANDLTGIHLYRDSNANGLIDAADTLLASGKFSDDNGNLTLTPSTAVALPATGETQFLIVTDVNTTLAALRFAPVLGSIFLLGFGLRRRWFALTATLLLLSACGSTPAPIPDARTYQMSVTAANITDTNGATLNIIGTPIAGATLSIQK